ncbi:hypothetical protein THOG11_80262 [Vibrio harveyi]|nr:hypothetical protein THOD03_70265 [Vibrio harveyi]CAH1590340.1 hypothetical protein THOG11_80262 [Vibrio harveyi]
MTDFLSRFNRLAISLPFNPGFLCSNSCISDFTNQFSHLNACIAHLAENTKPITYDMANAL